MIKKIPIYKIVEGIVIQEATINVADDKDMEFIEGLQSLGVNRNVAKLITYLKDVENGSSRDIEMATGMRQPEVSIAMRTLRDMASSTAAWSFIRKNLSVVVSLVATEFFKNLRVLRELG